MKKIFLLSLMFGSALFATTDNNLTVAFRGETVTFNGESATFTASDGRSRNFNFSDKREGEERRMAFVNLIRDTLKEVNDRIHMIESGKSEDDYDYYLGYLSRRQFYQRVLGEVSKKWGID